MGGYFLRLVQASLLLVALYGFFLTARENLSLYIESDWYDFAVSTKDKVVSAASSMSFNTDDVSEEPGTDDPTGTQRQPLLQRKQKFYILPMPEITTWLLGNFTERATKFYDQQLNEDQAEVWLHRGLERLSNSRTYNASEADVVIVPGYLHLNKALLGSKKEGDVMPYATEEWARLVSERVIPNKIHVVATPTWNPTLGNQIGLRALVKALQSKNIRVVSFGFERNQFWQKIDPGSIVTVPYVVKPVLPRQELEEKAFESNRTRNFVFYTGSSRTNAVAWAGCDRTKMIAPLESRTDMEVRIVGRGNRISQDDYNSRMFTSEYCLILCGDTPSSRSMASSMLNGCIPLRVGSRLRGFCEPPCHKGWGWSIPNLTHIPFEDKIDWDTFPEVDEAVFSESPGSVLNEFFDKTDSTQKEKWRDTMRQTQMAWCYGWGNPVNSTTFGDAVAYAWDSLVEFLLRTGEITEGDANNDTSRR